MKEKCVLIGVDLGTKKSKKSDMFELDIDALNEIRGARALIEKDFDIVSMDEFDDLLGKEKYINVFYVMNYDKSYNTHKVKKHTFVKMYELYRKDDNRSLLLKNQEFEGMSKVDKLKLNQRMCRLAFKRKVGVNV